jgi:S-(hydroxymethyl)glutathione dehydrogenase / alcohol dehydrogenase
MKTPAAILTKLHCPLEIDEVEIPALGIGQVLVQIEVSRICGSQIGEIDGVKGLDRWLPHLLGHEGGGIVLETGPGVKTVKDGDRVVLHWRCGSGIESNPPKYKRGSQIINAGLLTTFNRFSIVSENRLTAVPQDTDMEIAALLADTLTTGFGIINNDAKLKIGESTVVMGCGGIGLGVVLGASLAGSHPIIAVDIFDHKLQNAKEYGATHVINSSKTKVKEGVLEILGDMPDLVVDGTGDPQVIETAYELTKTPGRTILFGVMSHENKVKLHTLPLHFGKILTGSVGGSSEPGKDIHRYIRMIDDGKLDLKKFVSHRIPLNGINECIQKMRNGEVIHAMVHL